MGEGGAKRRYVYTIAACKTGAAPHCSIDGTAQATVTVAVATGIAAPLWIQGPSSLPGVGCVEVGGGASHDFSIDWQSVAGATRYEVVEGDDLNGSYPNNPIIVNPTSNPTFQRLSLKRSRSGNADITYNYGVRACNATTCSEERRTAYMCLTSPGGPQSPMATTTVRYLHTDALGSPVAETDEFGTLVKRTRYEPYGAPTDGVYVNGPGFTGHVTDAATGLTYMQQRYYDPLAARFLSLDPVAVDNGSGGNFNRYWYANNNPYKYFDPDGRADKDLFGSSEIDLGPDYVGRLDRVPSSEIYEVHVYERGSSLDKAVENRDTGLLRKQEVGVAGPDGNFLNKHGHTKAPTLTLTASNRLRSVLTQEARGRGWLGEKGTVNIKGPNLGNSIRNGMRSSGALKYLGTLGKSLGPAAVATGMLENLSIEKACNMDPDFEGC